MKKPWVTELLEIDAAVEEFVVGVDSEIEVPGVARDWAATAMIFVAFDWDSLIMPVPARMGTTTSHV